MSATTAAVRDDERNWGMLAHLSGLLSFATLIGGLVAPLVIWLAHQDGSRFVVREAKEALNFWISLWIYGAALTVACFLLFGFLLLPFVVPVLFLMSIVLPILAAMSAREGRPYRYPLTIHFFE